MSLGFAWGWIFAGSGAGSAPGVAARRIATPLWINDTPLERLGLVLQRAGNRLHNVARPAITVESVPDLTGGRYGQHTAAAPLQFELVGVMLDIALEDQRAGLSALSAFLHRGLLELRTAHAPDEILRGLAGPILAEPLDPARAFVRPDRTGVQVSTTITCADSTRYARQPRRVRLSTAPKQIIQGDLPSGGEITLEGPLSGAVDIDLLSPSGVLLKRLALRGVALAEGDSLRILLDTPQGLYKRTPDGTLTNVYAWRSLALSDLWWTPTPQFADPARDQWTMLRLSTGAGWYVYPVAHGH
jgi:hypothetical protein